MLSRLLLGCLCASLLLTFAAHDDGPATAAVSLRYVALGDSLTALPGYVQLNASNMEDDLGADVSLVNLGRSGWSSTDLRSFVTSNRSYRDEIGRADVVTVGIGINDLWVARVRYAAGTCGGADQQDCLREAVATFRTNYDVIDATLRSLTAPRAAVIRPWDVYYPSSAADSAANLDTVFAPYWAQVNAHIAARASASNTPLAGVAAAFNGVSGSEDPVTKGYIDPDGIHLSATGSSVIADLFRANGWGNAATDGDSDDVPDRVDNCPAAANPLQENADSDVVDLAAWGKAFDDYTWPNSDGAGNVCDSDDDNDGLPDALELSLPGSGCPAATAATDPVLLDSDGDGVSDSGECVLSSDPASASSLPVLTLDTDRDGLFDGTEALIGTNPAAADSDADGAPDGMEVRRFATNPRAADTDGDGCFDRYEIGSVNADRTVNAVDLSQVFQAYGPSSAPNYVGYFDWNGDRAINAIDLMFAARYFGVCG